MLSKKALLVDAKVTVVPSLASTDGISIFALKLDTAKADPKTIAPKVADFLEIDAIDLRDTTLFSSITNYTPPCNFLIVKKAKLSQPKFYLK